MKLNKFLPKFINYHIELTIWNLNNPTNHGIRAPPSIVVKG